MAEYKNLLTLDGKIRGAQPGVTASKLKAVASLIEGATHGDFQKAGTLQEVMTTSDAPFSAAHLVTAELIDQFDKAERTWSSVASVRVVPDFRPVNLYSIFGDLTGAGVREGGGAARVGEAAPYPYVTVTGKEAFYQKLQKNGAKFGITWEGLVNDPAGVWSAMPNELLQLALDTEEAEVYDALVEGVTAAGASVQLDGGTLPDGAIVKPNSKITPEAMWQAVLELANREVNGRKVGTLSAYNVIVPTGQKMFLEWKLSQAILAIQNGLVTLGAGDRSIFNRITIIESDKIGLTNPDEWYLLPAKGAYRNRPVLELLRLRGHERPEVRVSNLTGTYQGGGNISPFEGSFDTDTVDMRLRYVAGGALWAADAVVYSDGSEA